jgi:hypothetical protein
MTKYHLILIDNLGEIMINSGIANPSNSPFHSNHFISLMFDPHELAMGGFNDLKLME